MRKDDAASGAGPSAPARARLAALGRTGLSAVADTGMDRFARLVANVLDVPVALVALAEDVRQVFPGMAGLGAPWSVRRQTGLAHSLCAYVVDSGGPLVVTDARVDERTRHGPVVAQLEVAGYAGMPLTDVEGVVLGALCAVDSRPRRWTEREVEALSDLAAACSTELRLRIVSRQAEEARAETAALLARSELVLRASEVLADTTGVDEVRRQLGELITSDLKPVHVGLSLEEVAGTRPARPARPWEAAPAEEPWPTARAVREKRLVTVTGVDEVRADYGDEAAARWAESGFGSMVCLPLSGTRQVLGALSVAWDTPHEPDLGERAVLAAVSGYAAQAVERALFVDERIDVARQLQRAMLTELPVVGGLELAALYRPAAQLDMVGGDWYDAYALHRADAPGIVAGAPSLAMTIGDITGHDTHAATLMGQARSMLRQADHDHPRGGPVTAVTALENANTALGVNLSGTLVHAHLTPAEEGWEFTWTNAGHPPPLLARPGGPCRRLDAHDLLLYPGLAGRRTQHSLRLPPGATLLLYTDGLVERPGNDIEAGTRQTCVLLGEGAGVPLDELLAEIADVVAGDAPGDDVALLALRVTGPPRHAPGRA
ncbi:SpoIIE family protein phosphatase [Streptomyces sp. LP05-1]|uniref:SpoIIE family protein phosphatase n=1 Tax=Streptomyces pyxinae TaxID=2970734 RepID=A0ABT2CRE6_9ACTN|nr:SpoIIE family protein phosphatase [Streptomyces sp. LP05-1]MCS0639831.1 SpoIIE family protein phosphatase [Streptomyces sp. LP05-1]